MAIMAAKKAPTGKYHIEGLRKLRALVGDYKGSGWSQREYGKRSFIDQVQIVGTSHIPHNHKEWRQVIRKGAELFQMVDNHRVEETLANLIAGERDARAKRKKAAEAQRIADGPHIADGTRSDRDTMAAEGPIPQKPSVGSGYPDGGLAGANTFGDSDPAPGTERPGDSLIVGRGYDGME